MTQASWPSPNHGSPARAVTDAEFPHLAPWASDGVFQSASDVIYGNSSGREVHVRAGKYGIVQGHAWYSGGSDFALAIGANSSGSTRVDTVVLRLDRSTWDVTAVVRAGTPGAGPPTLQRDAGDTGLWEIPLADVTVDNGVAVIASGKVTSRTLFQSSATRPCNVITDVQATLDDGDIVYEASTGRWVGWTGGVPAVLHIDSGWRDFNGIGAFTEDNSFPLKVRNIDNVCYAKGSVLVGNITGSLGGNASSSPISVAQLPAGFGPAENHRWLAPIGQVAGGRMNLSPSGLFTITSMQFGDLHQGQGVYLDTTYMLG